MGSAAEQGELRSADPVGRAAPALIERARSPRGAARARPRGGPGRAGRDHRRNGHGQAGCGAPDRAAPRPGDDRLDPHRIGLGDRESTRAALTAAGLAVEAREDVAFEEHLADVDGAVAAQPPAGPVVAAVRHAGFPALDAAPGGHFRRRRRAVGTVVREVVFRCTLARAPAPGRRALR